MLNFTLISYTSYTAIDARANPGLSESKASNDSVHPQKSHIHGITCSVS